MIITKTTLEKFLFFFIRYCFLVKIEYKLAYIRNHYIFFVFALTPSKQQAWLCWCVKMIMFVFVWKHVFSRKFWSAARDSSFLFLPTHERRQRFICNYNTHISKQSKTITACCYVRGRWWMSKWVVIISRMLLFVRRENGEECWVQGGL